jgi:chromosome segregation and condensation protein ScpB
MAFRKHVPEPLREVQIKEAFKRLIEKGLLEMVGERHDSRGNHYRITKEAL